MKKTIVLNSLLVVSAILAGLLVCLQHDHRHDWHWFESKKQAHTREAADLLKSALKEMGEGYDIASYKSDGLAGPDSRVIQYVQETGADPDAFSEGWCNPFVQFQLKRNGYKYSTDNRESMIMNTLEKTDDPVPGDIAMFMGHISFLYDFHKAWDGTQMADFLGGAQSGRVCIFSVPVNRLEFYARPIKAPKGWQPMINPFWLRLEDAVITVKRPDPSFAYPTPYPVQ